MSFLEKRATISSRTAFTSICQKPKLTPIFALTDMFSAVKGSTPIPENEKTEMPKPISKMLKNIIPTRRLPCSLFQIVLGCICLRSSAMGIAFLVLVA